MCEQGALRFADDVAAGGGVIDREQFGDVMVSGAGTVVKNVGNMSAWKA